MELYQADIGSSADNRLLAEGTDWKGGVLIRSTNWLGDAVMTLPAVYKISQLLPVGVKLNVLASHKVSGLWRTLPWVDNVVEMKQKRISPEESEELKKLNCGVAVILPNSFGSALDAFWKGIPVRIGRGGRMRSAFLTHRLPAWKRVAGQDRHHQLREYLQIASACGPVSWDSEYQPADPGVASSRLEELGINKSSELLVLAPGAAFGPAKQWPPDYHSEVARRWLERGAQVALVGTPAETEVCSQVAGAAQGAVDLAGKTNLRELMAILGRASACVVNDSGAMHLAAAMGAHGVAVFGSTDPRATGPLGGRWAVIWDRLECSPCLKRTCEVEERDYDCLKDIKPDRVWQSLEFVRKK